MKVEVKVKVKRCLGRNVYYLGLVFLSEFLLFGTQNHEKSIKIIRKTLPREGIHTAFSRSDKHYKTNEDTTFPDVDICYQKTL